MHSIIDLTMTLSRLPGVGSKSAKRMAYFLLEEPELRALLEEQLHHLANSVYLCPICACYSQEMQSCQYCDRQRLQPELLCVVERASDAMNLEASGGFGGLYHVLGGAISPMSGITPEQLRLESLKSRLESGAIKEVILATSFTLEGDATAHYLEQWLAHFDVVVSRIASGLSAGAQLEFADKQSLIHSMRGRQKL
ncbi:recombination mediator RecR [Entomospira culicis]|uniref:Recombination protein RecR n=1 Tax=Entomospira culicis TaxID=2719989 RepID=A0A968GKU9_9SPIO|nr:recombination mediator RecR [Entomospira culicis]NIZ19410.1 recombination protein RecR [Entomospira culicis]NIZ69685.1 recombination protein RecR [Entomospira culicis]WDI36795.1 recombination mediator RecR [Entomospira culicis]WDI38424.1 recombination mediator RecR [Entomospira culicis]